MLRMTAQQVRAMELINEWLEIIKDTYEAESLDGWLDYEDWGDVEYRTAKDGKYRGVMLYSEEDDNGLLVEIDTARETITVLDEDDKVIMVESVVDNINVQLVLNKLHNMWRKAYYEDEED